MENNLPYKNGTIKLTWINPQDYKVLESKMFDNQEEALKNLPSNIEPNNYLLFKLISRNGDSYKWELLDGGRSKEYINGMKFRDNKLLYYGTMGLGVLGIIFIFKLILKSK